jgi:murein DD-endopeptidase MepM/ murein hydrolase activator NlpD
MVKRGKTVKKTVTITEISKPKAIKANSEDKSQKLLLENFIALQEAIVNIGADLKDLNKKITSLLELFENAAKKFEEKPETRSLASKMNEIIEQNQTIAKTLLLMNKKLKEEESGELEGFKPSIKQKTEEDKKSEQKEEPEEKTEETPSSEEESDEFKPEPLPDFNF